MSQICVMGEAKNAMAKNKSCLRQLICPQQQPHCPMHWKQMFPPVITVKICRKEKMMIHASSSKGITFDKIDGSDYWEKRIYGFGSFIK